MKVIYKDSDKTWIDSDGFLVMRKESHCYCPACGALADKGLPFCGYCGEELQYDSNKQVGIIEHNSRSYSDRMHVVRPIAKRSKNSM